ncbi:MAG: hypothetical protein CVT66_04055 [Actinobacteria bacterium HGW-Actinobacteria-6]|jgi:hypothetical protein|nr:MAG: hypothetical protein CVT66_04055 [Actinobacteria bacterium HGW-Actinobacteria-6]
MASRTKLYQRAQSPLIQGRSKRERPFWQPLLLAFAAAMFLPLFVWWLITMIAGAQPGEAIALLGADFVTILAPMLPGALVGSYVGVWGARQWASRRAWLVGALMGAVLGGAGLLLFG